MYRYRLSLGLFYLSMNTDTHTKCCDIYIHVVCVVHHGTDCVCLETFDEDDMARRMGGYIKCMHTFINTMLCCANQRREKKEYNIKNVFDKMMLVV